MGEKYKTKKTEGQLNILFKKDAPNGMPDYIFTKLNYETIPVKDYDWYTISVGDEKKAIKNLEKYSEFIEWIEKRDIEWENKDAFISDLEKIVSDLDASLSGEDFYKKIKELSSYIEKFEK